MKENTKGITEIILKKLYKQNPEQTVQRIRGKNPKVISEGITHEINDRIFIGVAKGTEQNQWLCRRNYKQIRKKS